jgi:DNA-binding transcriptional ArsR family regulator
MVTATLKMKKATKSAPAMNETVLRTKTFQRTANLLKQVSDPTRLQVISLLAEGEHHVGGLCEQFNISQPAVSHHLALLRHGGIVERRRQGKNNFYTLTDTGYRLSKIVNDVGRWPAQNAKTEPPGESEKGCRVVLLQEFRSYGANVQATRTIKRANRFRVSQEVFRISDTILY